MLRFLFTAFLLVGTTLGQSSPEDTLRHAMELQQAGDLEGAVQGYRQFLAARPKEAAIRANLGVLLAHLGRFDEAITEYKKAAALDPQNGDIVRNFGLAYYKSGRIEEAASEFAKSHELSPDNLQTILLLADCQLRVGENRDVIKLLTPVEAEHSDDLAIAYLLGTALINDGQISEGQKRVDRILSKGDSAKARFLLGNQMFAAKDFPAAVKQLASAIELNPSLPGLQSLYGQALLNTGDPDAAAEAFRRELASDPNQFEAEPVPRTDPDRALAMERCRASGAAGSERPPRFAGSGTGIGRGQRGYGQTGRSTVGTGSLGEEVAQVRGPAPAIGRS